ncbi:MAG TPA: DUF1289 domain-containing protein [Porticoccaceae bacterium]|nr:DUF1289 domain-containing protein [Porticoccaceae bacterium]HCO58813.1 DUF1289 domain-containing protein [Porticoccaceae bacterium]
MESNSVSARVASPCVSICLLDEDDICTGCYRSGAEISGWVLKSDAERRAVVVSARQRAKAGNPFSAD